MDAHRRQHRTPSRFRKHRPLHHPPRRRSLSIDALQTLKTAVDRYLPYLLPSGDLIDPVFLEPTQYSTPYYAYCNAVLATYITGSERSLYAHNALQGLRRSLQHLTNLDERPAASGFRRDLGTISHSNHRDFFWPPVLKTFTLLQHIPDVAPEASALAALIAAVDITSAFRTRPPSNWSAVWLLGEWLRLRAHLSSISPDQIDRWIAQFFDERILLGLGFYQEPGHPNSYDLFTRLHLLELLANGYTGDQLHRLQALLVTGLTRSLAVQLSDGSLASAHRSTGQTWTVGAQCAYFTIAAELLEPVAPQHAAQARLAAQRAFHSFNRWQRPGDLFSPVENLLPPTARVGYEAYTADAHYASLALAFLATAISYGLTTAPASSFDRRPTAFAEADPTYRALAHAGPFSLHVNALPASHYDAFGIVDLTTGPGRYLHLVSTAHCLQSGQSCNLGLATRESSGLSELTILAQRDYTLLHPITTAQDATTAFLFLEGRAKGAWWTYRIRASLSQSGVTIEERTPNLTSYKTLLIPYLRDAGTGHTTTIHTSSGTVTLQLGDEQLHITLTTPIERLFDIPTGYENRRGYCGLLRIDFAEPSEGIIYTIDTD